jgi:Ala-tRNA(Pro) deacylase
MEAIMTMLDTIEGYLQETGTPFTHTTHRLAYTAREVARAEQLPPRNLAKTVVVHDDSGYSLAVLPADCLVDLFQLRTDLGRSHLRLATESEIATLFPDCELGAMPPLGNLCGLPVYADASLAEREWIAFNAGTHRDAVHMRYSDFERLARPITLHFSRPAAPQSMRAWDL